RWRQAGRQAAPCAPPQPPAVGAGDMQPLPPGYGRGDKRRGRNHPCASPGPGRQAHGWNPRSCLRPLPCARCDNRTLLEERPMIIVTGAARSGTSLTTRILQAHGCHLGSTVNGLYENTDVRDGVVKRYLRSIGADPLGQSILADTDNLAYVPGWRKTVERHFRAFPKPWAYKCAKATLIWPVWHEAFPDAKWIIVRRNKR